MKFGFPPYYETDDVVVNFTKIPDFKQQTLEINDQKFYLTNTGDPEKNIVLFIHGSPGAWNAWANYLIDTELRDSAFLIAVDRMGYGLSDNGHHEPSLEKQASSIMNAVNEVTKVTKNIIVVGHSYGGPVALRMAVDYPDKIKSLILLAPSISPEYEELRWYNKWADKKFIKQFLPEHVKRSNDEIMPLKKELLKMEQQLSNVKIPVSVIQGKKDKLVPMENAYFAEEALVNSNVDIQLLDERGHFIPWEEYDLVKKTIQDYLQVSN